MDSNTYIKTLRLARLIGMDYHASESKRKVWRQVKRIRFQTQRGHGWTPWRPHKCEADLEPIKEWLKRRHPDWPRTTGCDGEREHCEAFCDAVLAAFDRPAEAEPTPTPEPEPTTIDQAIENAITTLPAKWSIELELDMHGSTVLLFNDAGAGQQYPHRAGNIAEQINAAVVYARKQVAPEPPELAEHNDAVRNEWRERAEKAEAEVKRLTKALADADRDECCTAYKTQQRAEIERLKADLARAQTDAETYLRIGQRRGEARRSSGCGKHYPRLLPCTRGKAVPPR